MKHELMKLTYEYNSLEPYIDAQTMEIHHSKHHKTYVDNLNAALEKHPELFDLPLDELLKPGTVIPGDIAAVVKNQAGGVYNHNFFWSILIPVQSIPDVVLLAAIEKKFENLQNFKDIFTKAALGRFGSGWAWLVLDKDRNLEVYSTANQDTPISEGNTPLLTVDVWEHAYYLKYQNRRGEYVNNFWNVVNWDKVSDLFKENITK
jgi:Fe-Mn family superoxide dismutase